MVRLILLNPTMETKCCEKCGWREPYLGDFCRDKNCPHCHSVSKEELASGAFSHRESIAPSTGWEAEFDEFYTLPENMVPGPQRERAIKSFITHLLQEEREKGWDDAYEQGIEDAEKRVAEAERTRIAAAVMGLKVGEPTNQRGKTTNAALNTVLEIVRGEKK